MGYNHQTEDYLSKKSRKENVLELIEKRDWKGVIDIFEVTLHWYRHVGYQDNVIYTMYNNSQ